jgi:2-keto-4-pentenoate hydratase/2-oxohepta-3-ene-1,7-dioic acid hydratase in catechol pathway
MPSSSTAWCRIRPAPPTCTTRSNWSWRWARDAPAGELPRDDAASLVFGYGVGLDLTRRDLQAAAKAKGLPWDTGKGFDHSAPVSELVPASDAGDIESLARCRCDVNGERRQQSGLDQLIWNVPDILHELSKLYALRAGDLVFMGTPAGVARCNRRHLRCAPRRHRAIAGPHRAGSGVGSPHANPT